LDVLNSWGFAASALKTRAEKRTADIRATKGGIATVIEVKSREVDGKSDEAFAVAAKQQRPASYTVSSRKNNSISAVIKSGARQLEQSVKSGEYSCLWFRIPNTERFPDAAELLINTLLGIREAWQPGWSRNKNCYFADPPDFARFSKLDMVVVDLDDNRAKLFPNPFSCQLDSLSRNPLFQAFSETGVVKDILHEESRGEAYIAGPPYLRRTDAELADFVRQKYPSDFVEDNRIFFLDLALHAAVTVIPDRNKK
jgi:hypothetical protein